MGAFSASSASSITSTYSLPPSLTCQVKSSPICAAQAPSASLPCPKQGITGEVWPLPRLRPPNAPPGWYNDGFYVIYSIICLIVDAYDPSSSHCKRGFFPSKRVKGPAEFWSTRPSVAGDTADSEGLLGSLKLQTRMSQVWKEIQARTSCAIRNIMLLTLGILKPRTTNRGSRTHQECYVCHSSRFETYQC